MEVKHCGDDDLPSCPDKSNDVFPGGVVSHERASDCEFENMEDSRDFGLLRDFEFCESNEFDEARLFSDFQRYEEQLEAISYHGLLDSLKYDIATPSIETCLKEIAGFGGISSDIRVECAAERSWALPLTTSLEILNRYKCGLKRMRDTRDGIRAHDLSTVDMIRIAGAKFIQSSTSRDANGNLSAHPYDYYLNGYPEEVKRNVRLAMTLFAAAEKVGAQKFEAAIEFLDQCDGLSSACGNSVERIVHHFSGALRERIDREKGTVSEKGLGRRLTLDIDAEIMKPSVPVLMTHQQIPFFQLQQLCTMQTIMENVAESKKVHVIDLGIRNGSQWVILMQVLAARQENPVELLKITAIGTFSPELIEGTGKRLEEFAEDLKLPFSFNIIMLSDMNDFREDLIGLQDNETVIVYAQFLLRSMIPHPDRLEFIMSVIKRINPIIMVVAEIDANLNSPVFVARFVDALLYYSAFFDSFEDCMKRDDENRKFTECVLFAKAIRTIVAAEGEERSERHVKLNVWRAFFHRYRMIEVGLGISSMNQVALMKNSLPCAKSCTLAMNGKSLVIGWKDTPICFLSTWKFPGTSEHDV
ncbi:hypothetical protein MLD38_016378 [Melastoma candidum]|uniref:Uncharacterized protein n=1 Tax=Melastoma candidum TaxID=119954 RepID=A0ACB9RMX8_9MYRT|nr:hypothetical protein MLD38_016378 [Melastoma candidum]